MKVVIDIPEDDYKLACNYPDALIACYAHYIKAGVPLPKKHGRLIDADKLELDSEYDDGEYWAVSMVQIKNAPTVIEAEDGDTDETE